jgi:mRNA-degrading endonuclease RelE of RelBE toxin-antitoxin system
MSYTVNFSEQALADADRLERDDPKAFKKFLAFVDE